MSELNYIDHIPAPVTKPAIQELIDTVNNMENIEEKLDVIKTLIEAIHPETGTAKEATLVKGISDILAAIAALNTTAGLTTAEIDEVTT